MTIGKGLNYYWKFQALDSIQTSSSAGLPKEEISKLIDTLIDDYQIKDILMKIPLPTVDKKSMDSTPQITTGAKEEMRLEIWYHLGKKGKYNQHPKFKRSIQ